MAEWTSSWYLMSGSQTMYVKLKVFNQTGTSTATYTLYFSKTGSDSNLYHDGYSSLSCQIGTRTVSNQMANNGTFSISNISASESSWPSVTNIAYKWDKTALSNVYLKESTYLSISVDSGGGGGGGVITPNDNPPQAANITTKGYVVGNQSYAEVSFTRKLYKSDGTEDTSINIGVPGRKVYTDNGSVVMRNDSQDYSRKPSGTPEKLWTIDGTFTPGRNYNYELTLEQTFATGYVSGQIYIQDAIKNVTIATIPMKAKTNPKQTWQITSSYTTEYGGQPYSYSISYASNNSSKISVSNSGLITYNDTGSATITVTYTQYFPEINVTITKSASQIVYCGDGFPQFEDSYQYINDSLCWEIWNAQVYLAAQPRYSGFEMPYDLSSILPGNMFSTHLLDVYDLFSRMLVNTRELYKTGGLSGSYPTNLPSTFPKRNRSDNSWKTIINNQISDLKFLKTLV